MATYGITEYGTDVYGLSLPPAYLVPNFTATPVNYSTIQVSWGKPSGTIWRYRLLTNRYGYPVNEEDGTILFDTETYPGGVFNDSAIVQGSYHHYAMYVLVDQADNIWIRSGVTACLAPGNFGNAQWLWDRLPNHFKYLYDGGELTGDASGNSYLQQFLNIIGWGFDRIRTQYETYAQYLNDPYNIPENDLINLAAQVGLTYAPGTPAYAMRKGVANQAVVSRQRGTALGLANEITIRTGWGADVHMGQNLMLNTDQSAFLAPAFEPWDSQLAYKVGECVWVGTYTGSNVWSGTGYWYQCAQANIGQPPPGNGTSNSYWTCLNNTTDFTGALTTTASGQPSTWEALYASSATAPASGTLDVALGVQNVTGAGYAWNSLQLTNNSTSTQSYLLRSVARTTAEQAAGTSQEPDALTVINNGIPVPWTRASQEWNATTRYSTGDIVSYQLQPFVALRASTGATPPTANVASAEWAPLSESERIRICESAYGSQNTTISGAHQVPVFPFVEWFDQHGNYITRVYARTSSNNGTTGKPNNLAFDSFTSQSRVATGSGNGTEAIGPWQATFWANPTMSGPSAYTRTDQSVDFTWNGTQPAQSVGNAGWSASWVTTFAPAETGNYTFTLTSPGGGSRLLVNDQVVVDNWAAQSTSPVKGVVTLTAGSNVTVEIDYYVPTEPTGASTSNLIPGTWNPPTTLPASWTSPLFPVIAGNQYTYTVSTSASAPAEDTEPEALTLSAPTGLSQTAYANQTDFAWSPVSGATSYDFQIVLGPSTSTTQFYRSTYTGTHAEGVATNPSTEYSWHVAALSSSGYSPWSAWKTFTTPAASANITVQISWYDGQTLIGQVTNTGTNMVTIGGSADSLVPAGANWASVYVSLTGTIAGFSQSFTQLLSQVVPSGLELTSPVPYVASGTVQYSPTIAGRLTDDAQSTWAVPSASPGTFKVGSGLATPQVTGQRTVALLTGPANTNLAVTFRSGPDSTTAAGSSYAQGIVFRWASGTSYWRSDRHGLAYNNGGTWTVVGAHSTAFSDGDRMTVILNGSAISVLRNGVQVNSATSSFNSTATSHGMVSNDTVVTY